jgi:hypothetical protein
MCGRLTLTPLASARSKLAQFGGAVIGATRGGVTGFLKKPCA